MSTILDFMNTYKKCGSTENVRFGFCLKCAKEKDLSDCWNNPGKYVLVPMHKDEYEKYYKNDAQYDTREYPLDEEYVMVYLEADFFEEAKRKHEAFERN